MKKRDPKIDILRGFAAVIVVAGHTLQQFDGAENNIIFNIIFSVQMPLFMMISGYVHVFSGSLSTINELAEYIRKRMLTLLLPWLSWSVIAYLLLCRDPVFSYIRYAAYKMEVAFWFLFSLWSIEMIYSVSRFLSGKIFYKVKRNILVNLIFYGVGCLVLLFIGLWQGITFMAIKYTLYYSIFFWFGIFAGKYRNSGLWDNSARIREIVFALNIILYAVLIAHFNIIRMPDSPLNIVIRAMISISACWIALEIIDRIDLKDNIAAAFFQWVGTQSLELYVVHYFVVRLLDTSGYSVTIVDGFGFAIVYFVIVILISFAVIWILKKSRILSLVLFGKKLPVYQTGK
ncbi:MAG: acyltransferase family protein [Lachnospiraceae bacterium]|nr:acyltransferase family protein [Lachnospiraceae bacterium]